LKRLFAISILLAIVLNLTSVFIVFKIQQCRIRREIKHQIKAGIPEGELHEFNLSKKDYEQLDWVRPDIEFRKGNEMFDIVRTETTSDSIQLHCVNDKEEAVLFTQLDELIQKKMEKESSAPNSPISKVVKILKLVYVTSDFKDSLAFLAAKELHHFADLKYLYSSPYLEVLTPPPDTV
jgi:hypothetical protein